MKMKKNLFVLLAMALTAGIISVSVRSFATEEGPKGCRVISGDLRGKCSKNTEETYTCFVAGENDTLDCTSSD